tara:strand:- start:741 stop:1118 length:378 start_codon:yes stop_codon:yes gene_type:complete
MRRRLNSKTQSLKRKIIAEWRGVYSDPETKPATLLSDEVVRALDKLQVGDAISESDILCAWNDIMPAVISENTRPTGFKNGHIEISVLQPSILYTLDRQMKPDIVKKLQGVFGRKKLKGVNFRLG